MVIAATFCASLNVGIEAIAYRRLRNAPRLAPLITAVAMSFILQGVGLIFWGPRPTTTNNIVGVEDLRHQRVQRHVEQARDHPRHGPRPGRSDLPGPEDPAGQGDASSMMGINVNRTCAS